ncbi:MAG: PspA/IM30 family protein [Candidatus Obscuribacterales bacterium]|nr:PspA/IM30 family protein [Candidatus Obscuribacterales bacterium]
MWNDELESELAKVRQSLAGSIAVEKQIQIQIQKNAESLKTWEKRAEMARASGHEDMAVQADLRVKQCQQAGNDLTTELQSQQDSTLNLKKELARLENRRFSTGGSGKEAIAAASSTLSTIDRMENKIVAHEAESELSRDEVDRKFAADSAEKKIDDELQALKASLKKD